MAGKGKRPKQRQGRVAGESVKVRAVRTTQGPPATAVHVEVQADQLRREVGDFEQVRGVVARIPESTGAGGEVHWREQPLQSAGSEARTSGDRRETVERYFNVHYGPADAQQGVGVLVETDRGTVRAQSRDEAYTVKDDSKPGESARRKRR